MHIGFKFLFIYFFLRKNIVKDAKKKIIKIINSNKNRPQPPELTSQMLLSKSFSLRLYIPVKIFSVMSGRSQRFLGLTT